MVALLKAPYLPCVFVQKSLPTACVTRFVSVKALPIDHTTSLFGQHRFQGVWQLAACVQRGQNSLHSSSIESRSPRNVDPAEWAAQSCPQSARAMEGTINCFNIPDAVFQQVDRFPVHGVRQAIGDKSWNILLNYARLFTVPTAEALRYLEDGIGRLITFDQL